MQCNGSRACVGQFGVFNARRKTFFSIFYHVKPDRLPTKRSHVKMQVKPCTQVKSTLVRNPPNPGHSLRARFEAKEIVFHLINTFNNIAIERK